MTLALLSFLAGVLTILAPCVLPVLPVVLAGSVGEKQKWYPYLVTFSLAVSVVLFTVLLKASTAFTDIDPSFWKYLSGGILLGLGLVYIFPHGWSWIATKLNFSRSSTSLDKAQDIGNPVFRAIVTGAALGPVFSTCSPTYSLLLATVFPVSFLAGVGYTFIYALGLSLMLTLIAVGGRSIIAKFRGIADERGWFKKFLGIVFILIGFAIVTGFDKKIETYVLERFDISKVEEGLLDSLMPQKESATEKESSNTPKETPLSLSVKNPFSAPEITLTDWINSSPLTMAELKGKVVIIDFWTYSCINCQRTLPYLVEWDKKYRDKGLVIIGVHAPEFAFERNKKNVEKAVKDAGIEYPVVLDNDFSLWNDYKNRYWPAKYFIDKNGNVRHYHFGEGAYGESEKVIQHLLGIDEAVSVGEKKSTSSLQTPETYLGTSRRANFVKDFSVPLSLHEWSLGGEWSETKESITAMKDAKIRLKFAAKDVYLVLGGRGTVSVTVDGKSQFFGKDATEGEILVDSDRMYHIVQAENVLPESELELTLSPGVQAFAFTFGS